MPAPLQPPSPPLRRRQPGSPPRYRPRRSPLTSSPRRLPPAAPQPPCRRCFSLSASARCLPSFCLVLLLFLFSTVPPSAVAEERGQDSGRKQAGQLRNDSWGFKNPRFTYSPLERWHIDDPGTPLVYTNFTGAKVTTNFIGSAIYLSSSKKADRYILRVVIDGSDSYDINLNGPTMDKAPEEVLWGVQLVEGNHTFLAYNVGADPARPFIALAALTITTGQRRSAGPTVVSATLDDARATLKPSSAATPIAIVFVSVVAVASVAFLGIKYRQRRNVERINRYMLERHAQLSSKLPPTEHAPVKRSPHQSHHYFPVQTLSSIATLDGPKSSEPISPDATHQLDPLSVQQAETRFEPDLGPEGEALMMPDADNESEFWRSRPAPERQPPH